MTKQSRREFLEQSMSSGGRGRGGSWSAGTGRARAEEAVASISASPNEKMGVAIVGAGGRGMRATCHFLQTQKRVPDIEVLWIVDPDEKVRPGAR